MASAIKSALPSHLKPGNGGEEGAPRHHGKTRSHMVSATCLFPPPHQPQNHPDPIPRFHPAMRHQLGEPGNEEAFVAGSTAFFLCPCALALRWPNPALFNFTVAWPRGGLSRPIVFPISPFVFTRFLLLLWCAGECGCEGLNQYFVVPSFFDRWLSHPPSPPSHFSHIFLAPFPPLVALDLVSPQPLPVQHLLPASVPVLIHYHGSRTC